MQRESKQRSKPSIITIPRATDGTSPPLADRPEAQQTSRKRRPSRIDLKGVRITANTPTLKPSKKSAPATRPPAKAATNAQRARLSALDAAAQVCVSLTGDEAKQGITAQDLIDRMAKQKLWTSPGGKTPQATLYAAMVREIAAKGAAARFRKVSKGHFAASASGLKATTNRKPMA